MTAMRPKRAYHRKPQPEVRAEPLHHEAAPVEAVHRVEEVIPERPTMRPTMREEDSRARAARRAAELLNHIPDESEVHDSFAAPTPPDGWSYEWKAMEILGKEVEGKETRLGQTGWEPVPVSRHPEMMPRNHRGETIKKEGMVLMERPATITKMMRDRDYREARSLIRSNEEKLGVGPKAFSDGKTLVDIKKSHSPVEIPADS